MWKWASLLLLAAAAWPAMAAKTMSIEQAEQYLLKLHGQPDAKVAQEIGEVEITERVSTARLEHWKADLPGERTREALMKLADQTAFLDPPMSDVLRDPTPDNETQEKMLALASEYVSTTMTRLPNFYATRLTTHFEDMPSLMIHDWSDGGLALSAAEAKPLGVTGIYSAVVTYRNGHEVLDDAVAKDIRTGQAPTGLTTAGEFGPILGVVISDVMQSQVHWGYWEQGESKPVAIFQFYVPAEHSNFSITFPVAGKIEHLRPGYHGEMAIDPASGTILRLSVVAEMKPPHEMIQTAMEVVYATQKIGERSYVCPAHGVAYSRIPIVPTSMDPPPRDLASRDLNTRDMYSMNQIWRDQDSTDRKKPPPPMPPLYQMHLNDVAFTQYHLFKSEVRILPDGSSASEGSPAGAGEAPAAQPVSTPSTPR
jgi:hypothetical protein